jgi:hypothetical protein
MLPVSAVSGIGVDSFLLKLHFHNLDIVCFVIGNQYSWQFFGLWPEALIFVVH